MDREEGEEWSEEVKGRRTRWLKERSRSAQRAFLGRTGLIKHQKDGGDVAEPRVSSEVP